MDLPRLDNELTIEALRHCLQAGESELGRYKAESAEICLNMRESISDYNSATSTLLASLAPLMGDKQEQVNKIKEKLNKMCSIQQDFYEREERKCFYNVANTFMLKKEDNKDEIVPVKSVEDMLDAKIVEYQRILQQLQQQQHQ